MMIIPIKLTKWLLEPERSLLDIAQEGEDKEERERNERKKRQAEEKERRLQEAKARKEEEEKKKKDLPVIQGKKPGIGLKPRILMLKKGK